MATGPSSSASGDYTRCGLVDERGTSTAARFWTRGERADGAIERHTIADDRMHYFASTAELAARTTAPALATLVSLSTAAFDASVVVGDRKSDVLFACAAPHGRLVRHVGERQCVGGRQVVT